MNELKFASIKLISGEEILCYILDVIEYPEHNTHIIIRDPLKVQYVENKRKGSAKYSLIPWIHFTTKREHELDIGKVFDMCLVEDDEAREYHSRYFHKQLTEQSQKPKNGYVGSVNDFKKKLEHIYKNVDSYDPS